MKIGMLTLGCRVNQYESDAISEGLKIRGYEVGELDAGCDMCIINTCTVTAESDSKCRKAIRRALRMNIPVAVIGCFVQGAGENEEELQRVNYISGNRGKMEIVELVDRIMAGERFDRRASLVGAEYEDTPISSRRYVKAYVKIEDGCNNFCSYCYVPFVRGRVRSRDEDSIIAEVQRLRDSGLREIILTGIETSAYGEDREGGEPLCELVERISREAPIERLRFGSLNPSFFTSHRLERLAAAGVMPHFHLSVQSASDNVLKNMRRNYSSDDLYRVAEEIRRYFPDANLSCDMICGFPGETEADFEESMSFIKDASVLHTHIFPYSDRNGTLASKMPDKVSEYVKHERARRMTALANEVHNGIINSCVGKEYKVLVEFFKGDIALGYTESYINLKFPRESLEKGEIVNVRLLAEGNLY